VPTDVSSVIVLPHFTATGPPGFIADSCGIIVGLRTATSRGDILKGIMEGTIFYIRECVEALPETRIGITDIHVVGGGSKSDTWIQICADILDRALTRAKMTEAGALGAAILAGVGVGAYGSMEDGVAAAVRLERRFEPDQEMCKRYDVRFEQYRGLWPLTKDYLRGLASEGAH
jgi:xylulokinase